VLEEKLEAVRRVSELEVLALILTIITVTLLHDYISHRKRHNTYIAPQAETAATAALLCHRQSGHTAYRL